FLQGEPLTLTGFVTAAPISLTDIPSDRITQENLFLTSEGLTILFENISLSYYADSGSMMPLLGPSAQGIRTVPKHQDEIEVGDIVSFEWEEKLLVHRVIEKGRDEQGVYFITKGDNAASPDEKIRFEQIR